VVLVRALGRRPLALVLEAQPVAHRDPLHDHHAILDLDVGRGVRRQPVAVGGDAARLERAAERSREARCDRGEQEVEGAPVLAQLALAEAVEVALIPGRAEGDRLAGLGQHGGAQRRALPRDADAACERGLGHRSSSYPIRGEAIHVRRRGERARTHLRVAST
jgi:hypothetical protein